MITTYEARLWASQFVELGASLDQVNRELVCCNCNPDDQNTVISEFFKQLCEMEG